jgi:uncharacterized membrane protein
VAEHPGSRHQPEPAPRRVPSLHPLVRAGFIEYDRVIFFSDAVFAIAITLLAVNLRVPKTANVGSAHDLREAIPSIFGFVISFVVIAFFWIGHHGVFRFIVAIDRRLIALNLAFLGVIAFLPYPTALLSASSAPAAVIFYAACCAGGGLILAVIWTYATRPDCGLVGPEAQPVRKLFLLRIPLIFLMSIPVAIAFPKQAPYVWLLIWMSGSLINRFWPQPEAAEES